MYIKYLKIILTSVILIFSCTNNNKENSSGKLFNNKNKDFLSDIFTVIDSCYLNYPEENFPSIIYDVAINNNSIYIVGRSKVHPVVKFNINGLFQTTLGKIGRGPGEFITSPTRMAINNNLLAVLLTEFNKIVLFKGDKFYKEKYFSKKYRFSDLTFINDSTLAVSGYGSSEKHLYIINTSLNLINSYVNIPNNSKIAGIISTQSWGIQFYNDKIISHYLYPNVIIKSDYNIRNNNISKSKVDKITLGKYKLIDSSMIENSFSEFNNANKMEISQSISKIYWVLNINDYLIGTYFYYGLPIRKGKVKQRILRLFIIKNNKLIMEQDLDYREVGFIIPQNNKILSCQFKKKANDIKIKLIQLAIDENKLLLLDK